MNSQSNSYDIYIGNLSVNTSREKLRLLFSEIGEIWFVWINEKHQRFTYAFVAFHHLIDAKKACEQFNNQNLDGSVIKVSLSLKTQQKLANCVRKRTDSILLELPKRTDKKIPTKEDKIREILRNDLVKTNNKEFVTDFFKATIEAEDVVGFKECEIIKTKPETSDLKALQNTIERYFKKTTKANSLFKEVDFDLTKNKVITSEQYNKFFVLDTKIKISNDSTTTTTTTTTTSTTTSATTATATAATK